MERCVGKIMSNFLGLFSITLLITPRFGYGMDKLAYLGVCGEIFSETREEKAARATASDRLAELASEAKHDRKLHVEDSSRVLLDLAPATVVSDMLHPGPNPPAPDADLYDFIMRSGFHVEENRRLYSDQEWDQIVNLWVPVLSAAAVEVRQSRANNYCGPVQTLGGIGLDATRVIWAPVVAVLSPARGGRLFLGMVPSLVSDAVLAFPSGVMKASHAISSRPRQAIEQFNAAIDAFRNYTETVKPKTR